MYELGDAFPEATVEPGTNLLISGPPMTGKKRLAFETLAHGTRNGEGAIVVTTKDSADRVLEDYADHLGEGVGDLPVGVVDCVSRQQGMNAERETDTVRYASSPGDLTGMGIELSELLRDFYQGRGVTENRMFLYSLSTLLMYSDLQTVFRFLHVSTGRVQSADALGLFAIDSTAHDDQTMSTLKQLFDGAIEIRETDDGRERRLVGLEDGAGWQEF